jgi:hypothetical protein
LRTEKEEENEGVEDVSSERASAEVEAIDLLYFICGRELQRVGKEVCQPSLVISATLKQQSGHLTCDRTTRAIPCVDCLVEQTSSSIDDQTHHDQINIAPEMFIRTAY